MWNYKHTLEINARKEDIWRLYSDVGQWPIWDKDLEQVQLDGPFASGTTGTIQAVGQKPVPFKLTTVKSEQLFTNEAKIAGSLVTFSHELTTLENGSTRITHSVQITGPTSFFIGPLLGRQIAKGIPLAMSSLAALAAQEV